MLLSTPYVSMPIMWQISLAIVFLCGVLVCIALVCMLARPLARGLSHGLFETVLYYKCGVPLDRVFVRLVRALTIDFLTWGLFNTHVSSNTNNLSGWYGAFSWRFNAGFTRANSIKENIEEKAKREAARKQAMEDDI